jgi:hypothetical protein
MAGPNIVIVLYPLRDISFFQDMKFFLYDQLFPVKWVQIVIRTFLLRFPVTHSKFPASPEKNDLPSIIITVFQV